MVATTADDTPDALSLDAEMTKRVREEAKRRGVDAKELLHEMLSSQLEEDARFIEAVDEGFASAERDGWLDGDAVKAKHREKIARIRAEHAR